jgi:hypothetical protein
MRAEVRSGIGGRSDHEIVKPGAQRRLIRSYY